MIGSSRHAKGPLHVWRDRFWSIDRQAITKRIGRRNFRREALSMLVFVGI